MKKMKKILFIFLLSITLFSCDEWLIEEPKSSKPITGTTLEDAQAAVNGIYAFLRNPYNKRGYADLTLTALELTTGQYLPAVAQDGFATEAYDLSFTRTNTHFADFWISCYQGIEAANIAIDGIPNIDDSRLTDEIRSELLGEAHMLRAYYYFVLVQLFGDIPMKVSATSSPEDGLIGKSPIKDIYEQVIVPDLQLAETSSMPNTSSAGRVSKGAAKSLLAKVYLTMAGYPLNQTDKYALAKTKAKEVIDNNWYNLFQSDASTTWFDKLNSSAYDNLEENIFMVNYAINLVNNSISVYFAPIGGAGKITVSALHFGGMYPTDVFYGSYANEDLRAQNQGFFFNSYDGVDFELSVYKYFDGQSFPSTAPNSNKNFPLLRYADILLVYAEAQNAADGSPNADAYSAINSVRARAGLSALSGLSKSQFEEAVWRERAWELTCEGQVWYDMKRTQKAFNGNGFENFIGFTKPNGKTISEDNIYFPIPQSELDVNPSLAE